MNPHDRHYIPHDDGDGMGLAAIIVLTVLGLACVGLMVCVREAVRMVIG